MINCLKLHLFLLYTDLYRTGRLIFFRKRLT
nr:MAG TPA: hypothetical protein [Caudoviricetes sp.]